MAQHFVTHRISLYDVQKLLEHNSNGNTIKIPVVNSSSYNRAQMMSKASILCNIAEHILAFLNIDSYKAAVALYIGEPKAPNIIFIKGMYSPNSNHTAIKILIESDRLIFKSPGLVKIYATTLSDLLAELKQYIIKRPFMMQSLNLKFNAKHDML